MTIHDHNNGKKIILSKALDNRSKWLNVFYFIAFSMALPLMIKMVSGNDGGQAFEVLLMTGFIIAYAIAAYRFINKALQSEILYINPTTLMITKAGFLNSRSPAPVGEGLPVPGHNNHSSLQKMNNTLGFAAGFSGVRTIAHEQLTSLNCGHPNNRAQIGSHKAPFFPYLPTNLIPSLSKLHLIPLTNQPMDETKWYK